ncbi:TlpA family protein disulfide reductase [Chitinophaga sp. NPDC101104]|uniref:TlpA family protein disulfide reductase n=1 Tax=Chitinophaga sp. NPDC101104 TaxID=3390561 RepID=UPI003D03E1A3
MKAIKNKLLFVILLLITTGLTARSQERVVIAPGKPEAGETVTVTLDPSVPGGPIPAGATAVTVQFVTSNFYDLPIRIPMVKTNGKWTASFRLAPYAAFATFQLTSGNTIERPAADRLYEVMVYKNGLPVRHALLYRGGSMAAQMGKAPGAAAAAADLYEQELKAFPDNYEARLRLLVYREQVAKLASEKKAIRRRMHDVIEAKWKEAPSDRGNLNRVTMGYLIIGEPSRLDSIRKQVGARYPETALGRSLHADFIGREKDTARRITLLELALDKETEQNEADFSPFHEQLFELYARAKDSAKTVFHAGKVRHDMESPHLPRFYKSMAETLIENAVALPLARQYTNMALAMADRWPAGLIRYFPETGHIIPLVDDSTRRAVTAQAKGNLLSMLGLIDMLEGKDGEGEAHMRAAIAASHDHETLENVSRFYKQTGRETALAEIGALRLGELKAAVARQMIDKPAPALSSFVDLKGNPVTPESLRGKVVLIDFWATWCVPCMQEMPFVQKLYDEFKSNPDVVFMIVNSGAKNTLQDAQNWKGNKTYSFPVYYNTDPNIGEKFNFNIIPATYVIDKNGRIRFANIGFEGAEVESRLRVQLQMALTP